MAVLATDNFNRANGGFGANWSTMLNEGNARIVSNQVLEGGTLDNGSRYNAVTWPDDQYAEVVIVTLNTNTDKAGGVLLRCATAAETFYRIVARGPLGATAKIDLQKLVGGTFTSISSTTKTVNSNDVLRAQVSGASPNNSLSVYINGVLQIGPTTDASAINTGQAGIAIYVDGASDSSDAVIDNWEGGDLVDTGQNVTTQPSRLKWLGQTLRIGCTVRVSPAQKKWRGQSVVQTRGVMIAVGQSRWHAQSMRVGRVLALSSARMQWWAQTLQFPRMLMLVTARMQWQAGTMRSGGLVMITPARMQWQAQQGVAQRGGVSGGRRGYVLGMQRGYPRRQGVMV